MRYNSGNTSSKHQKVAHLNHALIYTLFASRSHILQASCIERHYDMQNLPILICKLLNKVQCTAELSILSTLTTYDHEPTS